MEDAFEKAKAYVAQEEVSDSGTDHIQGVIRYKTQKDLNGIKTIFTRAHLEICRDWDASKEYCQKLDTRKPGGKTWSSESAYMDSIWDPLKGVELYGWQKKMLKMIKEYTPEGRYIHWFWEARGNTGKTSFARHLVIEGYQVLYCYGKTADILYQLAEMRKVAKKPCDMPDVIIYDAPRGGVFNYKGLEQIKNGCFSSGKYESSMVVMNPPLIFVMANECGDGEKWSEDRLKIYEIDSDTKEIVGAAAPPPAFSRITRTDSQSAHWTRGL